MSIANTYNPRELTLADWQRAYQAFVRRQRFLGRWPFRTDEERKTAWEEWKILTVYQVAL